MPGELENRRVAFVVANEGVEQVELTEPWDAVKEAGADVELLAPESGEVQGFNHFDKGDTFQVDGTLENADPDGYDGLVLPGGVGNPDILRTRPEAVQFVRSFFEAGKPVGAICHAPWTLIEADVVAGRTVTSWPSLRTDLTNAGARWVDQEVVTDNGLVTSRKPADIPAFNRKMIEEFAEGMHPEQAR